MFIGHIVIAGIVMFLDVRWIQVEMSQPGWDGVPDMDAVFFAGLILRIVVINTVLLPIALLGLRCRSGGDVPVADGE